MTAPGVARTIEQSPIELRIDSIAAGGDGVGRHNGIVVFVPRTAPGDLARVRVDQRDRFMRGRLLEVVRPSNERTEPPCPHYVIDRCGGCQLQHLTYDAQIRAKGEIIRDAMVRIGRVPMDAPLVQPSEKLWRYRRKLTLALRREAGGWIAGLHRFDAPDEVFELKDCPITDERVLLAWSSVLARQQLLPPEAQQLRAAVRLLDSTFSFTVEGAQQWSTYSAFFDAVPEMRELWWKPEGKSRRLLRSRSDQAAGASFTQVNPGVAAQLREYVASLVTPFKPQNIVDAYAGTGDIAVELARTGARVTAIEIDRDAARVCQSRLPEGSRVIAAPVEKSIADTLPSDVVILNPPRAGVDEIVARILNNQRERPRGIIYVSCNPATLARDVRRMDSYHVNSVRGFDMFPQTAHVESVCELVPVA